jgi:hypothetical protein
VKVATDKGRGSQDRLREAHSQSLRGRGEIGLGWPVKFVWRDRSGGMQMGKVDSCEEDLEQQDEREGRQNSPSSLWSLPSILSF